MRSKNISLLHHCLCWLCACAGLNMPVAAWAGDAPLVVELFTSQGCSSCPPADRLLGELADRSGIIALSYHVDYWNYIGWKDPFSSPAFSDYQREYSRAMGRDNIFTPQIVVNGKYSATGSARAEVGKAMERAQEDTPINLRVSEGKIVPEGNPSESMHAVAVTYTDAVTTQVKAGENRGESLTNHHIVRRIIPLGEWRRAGQPFDIPALLGDESGLAVLLQNSHNMHILGAAKVMQNR